MTLQYQQPSTPVRRHKLSVLRVMLISAVLYVAGYGAFRVSPWTYPYYSQGSWEIEVSESARVLVALLFVPPLIIEGIIWTAAVPHTPSGG